MEIQLLNSRAVSVGLDLYKWSTNPHFLFTFFKSDYHFLTHLYHLFRNFFIPTIFPIIFSKPYPLKKKNTRANEFFLNCYIRNNPPKLFEAIPLAGHPQALHKQSPSDLPCARKPASNFEVVFGITWDETQAFATTSIFFIIYKRESAHLWVRYSH